MLKKSASVDKRYNFAFLTVWLGVAVVFCLVFFETVQAQEGKLDLTKPFKKCRVYGEDAHLQIVASDNEQHLILQTKDSNFYSFDLKANLENWRFQSGGKIEASAVLDENNLYFISSVVNETKQESFLLNSLSLKTGITRWQRKLNSYTKAELLKLSDRNLVFIIGDNRYLFAARKTDGDMYRQPLDLTSRILSVTSLPEEQIAILTADGFARVSVETGEIREKIILRKETVFESTSVLDENFFLLGNSVGEILKLDVAGNKERVFWKVKTGGSISGLLKIENEVLATSLDNFIYLFSLDSGKLKWKRRVSGRIKIKPVLFGGYVVVVTDGDNSVLIVSLRDGKVVNKIELEADNYFSGQPVALGNYLIVQTYKGIFFFVNGSESC